MAGSCYFYATRKDVLSVLDFIFASTDLKVFEAYSRIGHSMRSFESADQLLEDHPDTDNHGTLHLQAHSHLIYQGSIIKQINLSAKAGGGVRYSIESPAAIQVLEASYIKHTSGTFLDASRVACFTEAGARQRSSYASGILDTVDWQLLTSTFAKIERHIRHKLTVSRWAGRAVLHDAGRELAKGTLKFWPQA